MYSALATIDLGAYLERIGFTATPGVDLDTLAALQFHHASAIAFENLDAFLHRPVPLDLASIERKLVTQGRGGWCFEQNALFAAALLQIGFSVTGFTARVLWRMEEDALTPLTHMMLLVGVGRESRIVDVGFGALTPTGPLKMEKNRPQETPHETMRFIETSPLRYRLEALLDGEWRNLYQFMADAPAFPCDYEMANHFLATHDSSHFRHGIVAARPFKGGRHTIRTGAFTTYDLDGNATVRNLETEQDYLDALAAMEIRVPDPAALTEALAREGVT